ncbi:MAG TPA: cell division protein ZapB [Thermoanaerobaculia bacterium]|nr:cell division protein ZapB [Thermoanaerobaculia bacterium]
MARKNNEVEQLTLKGTEEGEILSRLSEKVERAIGTIQELRRERDALKARLDAAEQKVTQHEGTSERLSAVEEEHERFQAERSEIRSRIESILVTLESLDEPAGGADA